MGAALDLGAMRRRAGDRAAADAYAAAGRPARFVRRRPFDRRAGAGGGMADRVTDDHRSGFDAPGQWIALSSGGLATSSTTVRRWETPAGTAHHLVDPLTGQSADSVWRTVSVCAGAASTRTSPAPPRSSEATRPCHGLRGSAAEPARAYRRNRPPRGRVAVGGRRPAARRVRSGGAERSPGARRPMASPSARPSGRAPTGTWLAAPARSRSCS